MDDIFAVIHRSKLDDLMTYLNNINPHIKFTKEEEINSMLPYLDLEIIKVASGHLEFNVFKKEISSNSYLNFLSNHPLKQKLGVVNTLFNRAETLCSADYYPQEILDIKESLKLKNYPDYMLKKNIFRVLLTFRRTKTSDMFRLLISKVCPSA